VSSEKCKCEVRSAGCEACTVKCVRLALHCAGVVRLDNNRNSFAQSTHARAWLAHGAYIDDQGFIVYP
jgi:hypothetical protein